MQDFRNLRSYEYLIVLNVFIYIFFELYHIIANTFGAGAAYIEGLFALSPISPWYRFWTFFTYMFIHFDILHLIINMLLLSYFAKRFIDYYDLRRFFLLYIGGGILIAIIYKLIISTLSYIDTYVAFVFMDKFIIGSSASIMSVIFAYSFLFAKDRGVQRNYDIIIAFSLLLLSVLIDIENYGGHITHIIGAIIGIVFALYTNKKRTIKEKENYITDKLRYSGYNSLDNSEKEKLINISKKQNL